MSIDVIRINPNGRQERKEYQLNREGKWISQKPNGKKPNGNKRPTLVLVDCEKQSKIGYTLARVERTTEQLSEPQKACLIRLRRSSDGRLDLSAYREAVELLPEINKDTIGKLLCKADDYKIPVLGIADDPEAQLAVILNHLSRLFKIQAKQARA